MVNNENGEKDMVVKMPMGDVNMTGPPRFDNPVFR